MDAAIVDDAAQCLRKRRESCGAMEVLGLPTKDAWSTISEQPLRFESNTASVGVRARRFQLVRSLFACERIAQSTIQDIESDKPRNGPSRVETHAVSDNVIGSPPTLRQGRFQSLSGIPKTSPLRQMPVVAALALVALALVALATWAATRPVLKAMSEYGIWLLTNDADLRDGYVDVGDAKLYYRRMGHGPQVVLLHGGATSLEAFVAQIPELSRHLELIAVDLRGQGRSQRGSGPLTYRRYADDVACVLERLDVAGVGVVGWSDGGNTALLLALNHPRRVSRLVLLSANYQPSGLRDDIDMGPPGLLAQLLYRALAPEPRRWQQLVAELQMLWTTRPDMAPADLARIAVPTLILVAQDDVVDIDHSRALRDAIAGASMQVVPGTSHGLLWEQPELVNRALLGFLVDAGPSAPRTTGGSTTTDSQPGCWKTSDS